MGFRYSFIPQSISVFRMDGFVPVRIPALEWEVRRRRAVPASGASVESGRSLADGRDMTPAELILTALINGELRTGC